MISNDFYKGSSDCSVSGNPWLFSPSFIHLKETDHKPIKLQLRTLLSKSSVPGGRGSLTLTCSSVELLLSLTVSGGLNLNV